MRGMRLSRSSKSVVALLTGALLLLCQTVLAARGCQAEVAHAGVAAGALPCHIAAAGGDVPDGSPPTPCDSAKAVGDTFKPAFAAAADLPVLSIPAHEPQRTFQSFLPRLALATSGAPPPLRLLHCRLLI